MKVSFAAGLLAALAGMAFAAPADTPQNHRRNLDVSQAPAVPNLARLDSQKLSRRIVKIDNHNEQRSISEQEARKKSKGLIGDLLEGLLGPSGTRRPKPKSTKRPKSPKKPKKPKEPKKPSETKPSETKPTPTKPVGGLPTPEPTPKTT
ncbi:hypothetical protein HRG_005550 [Hirsutella rhossiliensis]|uniref:Uncharacterized protein n=1 Tax=Hirsutella rhossiliensis TaxID=111463 RepID=A0A9P8MXH3_9HYPO|nr:uncharacterized protein HRG_05550 [Hirsutella rhossiliensis]KAH0963040.1 hypothetical protein HRG_05550 [Hirsutella rhossiliensis]